MESPRCCVCGGPSRVQPQDSAPSRMVSVRFIVTGLAGKRSSELEVCWRCCQSALLPERASSVQTALFAELRALLR